MDHLVRQRRTTKPSLEEKEEGDQAQGSPAVETAAQHPRVMNIVGSAGTGKSRLAAELRCRVLERDGYFARGKCESCQTKSAHQDLTSLQNSNDGGTAYAVLAHAMKDLTDQILARDFDMGIRRRLQEAVGPKDARILTEIFIPCSGKHSRNR